ncbi:Eisosome component PIL1-domain-containing protein [Lipomyces japonicus]|uniref:Eisosome component PIL1-domain-containing protein n=1 Tax=Lipomyces japonicus TaxID=56871 RepID=UPI0034D002F6
MSENVVPGGPTIPVIAPTLVPPKSGKKTRITLHQPLSRLVKSLSSLSHHHNSLASATSLSAHVLSSWGSTSSDNLSADIADKLGVVLNAISQIEEICIPGVKNCKKMMQHVQDVEQTIKPICAQQGKLKNSINKARAKNEIRKFEQLERDLVRVNAESLVVESQIINVTRNKVFTGWSGYLNSLQERCEKELIAVKYARELLRYLDCEPIIPGQQQYDTPQEDIATRELLDMMSEELKSWSLDLHDCEFSFDEDVREEQPLNGPQNTDEIATDGRMASVIYHDRK